MTNKLPIYDLDNDNLPVYPQRSHLYHLKPIGLGTPFVESLTSYITRLAEAHCVSLRDLIKQEFFPLYGRSYLPHTTDDHNISTFWKDSPALNGTNHSTRDFIRVLEQLTLYDNLCYLSMLPWAELLSCRYLIRRSKAWCPYCYQEWLEEGMPLYDPLLWALEVVTICLRHKCQLKTYCQHCNSQSTMLAAMGKAGHCSHCGAWLGTELTMENSHCNTVIKDVLNWQRFVILTIGQMLSTSPTFPDSIGREGFARAIEEYLHYFADGKISVLARKLHISRRTIRDWKQGLQLPQLESLLQCCYLLNVSPLEFFNATIAMKSRISRKPLPEQLEVKEKVKKQYRVLPLEEIRKKLEAELLIMEGSPSPMSAVAKRLEYDHSFLRRHFPELCQMISDRNRAFRSKKREERKQAILDEIRDTTYCVHAQELYPSQERIRLRLTKPGSIREPGALSIWQAALQELGYDNRKP